ncbi:hypothetical protein CL654_02530 [bacterium]|nr:hypothetical protein [bacterium]|tara:strand:+ start:2825 stop:3367 length:543 start_codon:yes stop_codon:yes gene_type:complete
MNLNQTIEALLFFKGEPLMFKYLAKTLNKSEEEIKNACHELSQSLEDRGIVAVIRDQDITLGTHQDVSELIDTLAKEEVTGPLTKAALETLSIILYRAPITKSDIDYVRGVNSGFILRNLLIRGLIEKTPNPADARTFLYRPTNDLFSHLGIKEQKELPEYEQYNATMQQSLETRDDESL